MTDDLDARLTAALHRIATAHVPGDHPRSDRVRLIDFDIASRDAPARVVAPPGPARRRVLLGVAAGVVALAGIGALTVLAPRQELPSPPALSPDPTAADEAPGPTAPIVTLAVTEPTAGPDAWSRWPDGGLGGQMQHVAVATDGGLFVWGGYAGSEAVTDGAFYESPTGAWRTLPPAPLSPDRGDAIAVWTGREVVVMNGNLGAVKAAAFDPATFTWRALSDPPVDNAASATSRAVVVGDEVVLFSVFQDGGRPQNQVAVLDDIQSGHWSVAASPPVALAPSVDLVAVGDEVFVVGRTDPTSTECGALHVLAYTPADNSWREIDAGPASRLADPVTVWTGSELFVGGGGSCVDGVAVLDFEDSAHLLDPATENWRTAPPAPEGFYSSYRYADLWTGSAVATISPTGRPLLYDPATDAWHAGPAIDPDQPIAPNQTPMVLLDGNLVVAGGAVAENGSPRRAPFVGTYAYTLPDGFAG